MDLTTSVDCSDFYYYFLGTAPVSGNYTLLSGPGGRVSWGLHGGVYSESSKDFSEGNTVFYARSGKILCSFSIHLDRYAKFSVLSADCNLPVYKVVPSAALSGDTYNINTRPTSITGGNYGIVGDNGQITKVEDNSTIINETNNTFYNPATGTTVPIVNWSYDYSDRSYKVTLESGDTATITYVSFIVFPFRPSGLSHISQALPCPPYIYCYTTSPILGSCKAVANWLQI